MEGANADFQDWEVLLGLDAGNDHRKPADSATEEAAAEDDSDDGAIRSDYFALDSEQRYPKRGNPDSEEEAQVDSDNPSWIDPESDSRYVDRPKDDLGLAAVDFSRKNFGGFWSDESSDGQRSRPGSETGDLVYAGGSEVEERLDGALEEDGTEALVGGVEIIEGREMGDEDLKTVSSDESVKRRETPASEEEKNVDAKNLPGVEGENKGMVWWKLPLELIKFCAFRVKPVWSISIAAAFLGVLVLGKRLYKMKQRTRSIPLKINLDEKKASQLKVHAARLNEAFSVVRRAPVIRPQLPAGGLVSWPVLGFQ